MYMKLLLGIGLTFQLPVLMFVLARLGIVTAGFLTRNFKYAVLLIFIFAAVITPDGSPFTQLMVGGPMVVLYIVGIAAAWLFGKSKKSDPDDSAS
jgi:sec-independent protein translocase protein TatC